MTGPVEVRLGRLHQVAQRATNLDRSVEFYRDRLGARLIARFDPPGLAFFELEGVRLLLEGTAAPATLYFRVDDIDTAYDQLRARGVEFIREPQPVHRDEGGLFGPPGGEEWMAFFHDPDDNVLAIAARKQG